MTRTHEERLRTEMTVAQEVWRKDVPVVPIGQGQSPSDHRDQQHTAAWAEARFLAAGKEADETAVRVAAELAVGGRGLPNPVKDAQELATAITTVYGGEQAQQRSGMAAEAEPSATAGISYEGIDLSENEAHWRKGIELPGTLVRFDPSANVNGIDPHDTMDAVGTEPLMITKAVVRGESHASILGGDTVYGVLEYEFEGKDGRHNAKQFMEEGGRDHMYGVVLVRDDRMWAVPIHHDGRDGSVQPDGPAREIVGFAGRDDDNLHPGGFAGMRKDVVEEGAVSGEFYHQSRDGYMAPGPVNLLGSPWQSSASDDELAIAEASIEKAIARETREREDPVGVLVDAMSETSKIWRLERERVDFTGRHGGEFRSAPAEADEKTAMGLARAEAGYLMRGRDPNDANVRMAAGMVATQDRETTSGTLVASALADRLKPETQRASTLASAAAGLTNHVRTASKGPVPESALPPFGALHVRRSAER